MQLSTVVALDFNHIIDLYVKEPLNVRITEVIEQSISAVLVSEENYGPEGLIPQESYNIWDTLSYFFRSTKETITAIKIIYAAGIMDSRPVVDLELYQPSAIKRGKRDYTVYHQLIEVESFEIFQHHLQKIYEQIETSAFLSTRLPGNPFLTFPDGQGDQVCSFVEHVPGSTNLLQFLRDSSLSATILAALFFQMALVLDIIQDETQMTYEVFDTSVIIHRGESVWIDYEPHSNININTKGNMIKLTNYHQLIKKAGFDVTKLLSFFARHVDPRYDFLFSTLKYRQKGWELQDVLSEVAKRLGSDAASVYSTKPITHTSKITTEFSPLPLTDICCPYLYYAYSQESLASLGTSERNLVLTTMNTHIAAYYDMFIRAVKNKDLGGEILCLKSIRYLKAILEILDVEHDERANYLAYQSIVDMLRNNISSFERRYKADRYRHFINALGD